MAQVTDWLAQSYVSNSAPLNASRAVNFFAETEVQDAKSKAPVAVWGSPGISDFCTLPGGDRGPVMAFQIMNNQLFCVTPRAFYRISANGTAQILGSPSSSPNGVSIDNNGIQIVWVDGFVGWYWSEATGVQQIIDPNFFPSTTVTFFDTYFVYMRKGTRQFFLGPQNAVIPFDALLFATKEATSDPIVGIMNSHEQLYIFGERRTEVWYDAGNPVPTFPFQRSDGALIQRGLMAAYSTVLEDNTIFFLGDDGIYYRLDGFVPKRVSNHAIESEWQKYPTRADCYALVYTLFGHKFITLNFLTARKTWVLDLATERWHERESWIGSSADDSIGRWRGNCSVFYFDRWLIGDSVSGRIGQLNRNVFTEWGDTMVGRIVGPPLHNDRKRVFMKRFEIDVESGVGIAGEVPQRETYCVNPVVVSEDGYVSKAGALSGLGAAVTTALLSVWVNVDADGSFTFSSDGFELSIARDQTPQIQLRLFDAVAAPIVDAGYAYVFTDAWVNLLVSFDTAAQVLQVWASTAAAEVALTPDSLTWSSTTGFANAGTWIVQ